MTELIYFLLKLKKAFESGSESELKSLYDDLNDLLTKYYEY